MWRRLIGRFTSSNAFDYLFGAVGALLFLAIALGALWLDSHA